MRAEKKRRAAWRASRRLSLFCRRRHSRWGEDETRRVGGREKFQEDGPAKQPKKRPGRTPGMVVGTFDVVV